MKNIFKYTLMTAVFAGGAACTNLDEHLPGSYTQKFTPSNPGYLVPTNVNKAQPVDGLQAAFNGLLNGTATNGGFFAMQENGTDEAVICQKGGDWYDGGNYIKFHQHLYSSTTWEINNAWSHAYNGIFQCNALLTGPDAIPNITPEQTGNLKFLRAYYYWRLMDVFGNLKIVTAPGTDVAQSTRKDAFDFIEAQLLEAIPDLPSTLQNYGRANQAGAHALLAKIYLNAAVYRGSTGAELATYLGKAITEADAVINSGLYTLDAKYADVFSPTNVDAKEMIFVAPFDEAQAQGATWPHMTLHYPSQLTYKFDQQPWNGYATLEDFYNMYDAADTRRAANFITGPQTYTTLDGSVLPALDVAYDKADPDGAQVNYTPFINELAPNSSRQAGARFGKFSFKTYQHQNGDNDFPLLRYGEVLLNRAEAGMRLSGDWNDGTSLAYVKMLTDRAGAPLASPMTESDMLKERGRELFVEAHRRTDMIRFGVYTTTAWWSHDADGDANHNLMPIPKEQIDAARGTAHELTQNPGYSL